MEFINSIIAFTIGIGGTGLFLWGVFTIYEKIENNSK